MAGMRQCQTSCGFRATLKADYARFRRISAVDLCGRLSVSKCIQELRRPAKASLAIVPTLSDLFREGTFLASEAGHCNRSEIARDFVAA
jgi:hypothetical protein